MHISMRVSTIASACAAALVALAPLPAGADGAAASSVTAKEEAAASAAREWLKLVDEGLYGESWDGAAAFLKSAVTRQQWVTKVGGVRAAFGAVQKRELQSSRYTTTLAGAPDGQYVVLQYETSFAGKRSSVETITPMLDRDGKWRVSGYFVR